MSASLKPVQSSVEDTAFHIHQPVHRLSPQGRCVLHTHMPYAMALSTGRPLRLISEAVIQKTVAQFGAGAAVGGRDRAELHFDALKRLLDRNASDYAS